MSATYSQIAQGKKVIGTVFATFLKFDIVSKFKETGRQIEIVGRQEGAETKQRWKREQRVMEPRNGCQE